MPYNGLQSGTYQKPRTFNEILYLTVLGSNISATESIIGINLQNFKISEYKVDDVPIAFDVDEKYIYSANSIINGETSFKKIDIKKNQILAKKNFSGVSNYVHQTKNHVYLFIDEKSDKQKCYKLNKRDLSIVKDWEITIATGALDGNEIDGILYITNTLKAGSKEEVSKSVMMIDLETDKITYKNLDYPSYQVLNKDKNIYFSNYSITDNKGNYVTLAKEDTQKKLNIVLTKQLKGNLVISKIINNKFITTDENQIYEYDLKTFDLLRIRPVPTDMQLSTFFYYNE
ncbi:hypothetical protein ACLMAB_28905 [Brevibacillus laterosporus]